MWLILGLATLLRATLVLVEFVIVLEHHLLEGGLQSGCSEFLFFRLFVLTAATALSTAGDHLNLN